MRNGRALLACLSVVLLLAAATWTGSAGAQDDEEGTPDVEALQTQVAEQEATIEALQTQVAELKDDLADARRPRPTPTPRGGETFQINETISVDGWDITVTGWELSPTLSSDFETNTARGIFVLVYFTIVNTGDAPTNFPYDDLQLVTSEGRSYGLADDAMFNLTYTFFGLSQYDELQPGLEYATGVIFDVPADATGLKLTTRRKVFEVELA